MGQSNNTDTHCCIFSIYTIRRDFRKLNNSNICDFGKLFTVNRNVFVVVFDEQVNHVNRTQTCLFKLFNLQKSPLKLLDE